MAYKARAPIRSSPVATERIRAVLTLASQESVTTQNLRGAPKKNTVGYQ